MPDIPRDLPPVDPSQIQQGQENYKHPGSASDKIKRKNNVWIQDVDQFLSDMNDPHMQATRTVDSYKSQVGINMQRLDMVLKDPDIRTHVDEVAIKNH